MSQCAMVVVEGATVQPLHGDTTMIVLGFLVSIAAIGTMCWLLFNLTVFALPFFIGLNTGSWAYGTGLAGSAASSSVFSPPV